jgi:hypothetical protein
MSLHGKFCLVVTTTAAATTATRGDGNAAAAGGGGGGGEEVAAATARTAAAAASAGNGRVALESIDLAEWPAARVAAVLQPYTAAAAAASDSAASAGSAELTNGHTETQQQQHPLEQGRCEYLGVQAVASHRFFFVSRRNFMCMHSLNFVFFFRLEQGWRIFIAVSAMTVLSLLLLSPRHVCDQAVLLCCPAHRMCDFCSSLPSCTRLSRCTTPIRSVRSMLPKYYSLNCVF